VNLRERLLSHPSVFRLIKSVTLPRGGLERIISHHFGAPDGATVLDLGCGYGDFGRLLAERCTYIGIDHNPDYIAVAEATNRHNSAKFFVADVADPIVGEHGPYDLVMMSGVLHHLPDPVVQQVCAQIRSHLAPEGRFVAIEPVFTPTQRLSARLLIASDRGRHVRDEAGYRQVVAPSFAAVELTIVTGLLRIPYTHVVIAATR